MWFEHRTLWSHNYQEGVRWGIVVSRGHSVLLTWNVRPRALTCVTVFSQVRLQLPGPHYLDQPSVLTVN
jgi:hypothetical protein